MSDPTPHDARAALGEHHDDPWTISRRRLLQAAVAAGTVAALPPMWADLAAQQAAAASPADSILVVVLLGGGNDGLDTVIPYGKGKYYDLRPRLGVPAANVLAIDGTVGLHPSLTRLRARYDTGTVAVVQGVGYTPQNLSHFDSMARWMSGYPGGGTPSSGWLGRWLDAVATAPLLLGVSIGWSLPLHVRGVTRSAVSIPADLNAPFGSDRSDPERARLVKTVAGYGAGGTGLGAWADAIGRLGADAMEAGRQVKPAFRGSVPGGLVGGLTRCAQLINLGLGIRVLAIDHGSYDTHENEAYEHGRLLAELDMAIEAFFTTLSPVVKPKVAMMTFSEFGRRPSQNGSGTDHGGGSVQLVIGDAVRGGLLGTLPSLTNLDPDGNLRAGIEFPSVYASVLDQWLAADHRSILGATYPTLPLFR